MPLDPLTQQAVDRLLLEQNAYSPLELLLAEGRLLQSDYRAWLRGDPEFLEEALFGDPGRIATMLRDAANYVVRLRLVSEEMEYLDWGEGRGQARRFSTDPSLDRLFHTRYVRAKDIPQLDLFMDNAGAVAVSALIAALRGGDAVAARGRWKRLVQTDASHPDLGGYEVLVRALEGRARPVEEPQAEIDALEQSQEPLARALLGASARDLLVPAWTRIQAALAGRPFDPARPKLHASYPAVRAEDWAGVLVAVQAAAAPGEAHLPLLHRQLRASRFLRRTDAHLQAWFRICWRHPAEAEGLTPDLQQEWRLAWREFQCLDGEPPVEAFPAWLVARFPALARQADALAGEGGAPEGFFAMVEVLRAVREGQGNLIDARRRLRDAAPWLFEYVMNQSNGPAVRAR